MSTKAPSAPRCAVLVGPYLSGKTTLLEAILKSIGATTRKGTIKDGNTVGDSSPEARARTMSTEPNVATAEYLGDSWTFVDCPGSIELAQDAYNALMVADAAVVVCEPDPIKTVALSPVLRFLDERGIPHMVFINKVDTAGAGVRATVEALQSISERPMVLRELPIRDSDAITGFVDLVSERAFRFNPNKTSEMIPLPEAVKDDEELARTEMLESLADFDDDLMDKLLEDIIPPVEDVYQSLTKDLKADKVVPVFFGSAENGHGITRLLKVLRHEAPGPAETAARLGIDTEGDKALVFKSLHASQTGKLGLARVLSGAVADGTSFDGARISGLYTMMGAKQTKVAKAETGDVVGLGRMDDVATGVLLGGSDDIDWPATLVPLYSMAVHAEDRADEVKLSGALQKLAEEDASLTYGHNEDTGQFLLHGQGEVHLNITIDRLRNRYKLGLIGERPQVPYRETVRKPVDKRSRHKKQSGGHGEFGDVHLEIKPLPRGSGFAFGDSISGGVVPKNYIPAVEKGVVECLKRGPLGFPVVDIAVNLIDGQHHAVDSSDMAFQKAAQLCMREAMPNAGPVLLEPIMMVTVSVPNEFTSKVQRLVSGRRGQILGFDAKAGWKNWDEVQARMPASEMHDLVIELRSMTLGVGSYRTEFDHLQELSGKLADDVVAIHKAEE